MTDFRDIREVVAEMTDDEQRMRRMLALCFERLTEGYLYGDDGELQLQCSMPVGYPVMFIDFMREPVKDIEKKISDRNLAFYAKSLEGNP